jgi:hypothetical protein
MILKKRMVISKLFGGPQPPPQAPPLAVASALRGNKPKNIHRFTTSVKWYPRKCHDFVNQFILTIQLYYIFSV